MRWRVEFELGAETDTPGAWIGSQTDVGKALQALFVAVRDAHLATGAEYKDLVWEEAKVE